jgi:hypothetical protein
MTLEFNIATYNLSLLFDTRNIILRTGKDSSSKKVCKQYGVIKEIYDAALKEFEDPSKTKQNWWDHPAFKVTKEEKEAFIADRSEVLKSVCQKIFMHSEIILLQEIETVETLEFIKMLLPRGYDIAYSKDQKFDTAVIWNSVRFKLLDAGKNEDRKSTVVTLLEVSSSKIIKVASMHVPGYNLIDPKKDIRTTQFLGGDKIITDTLAQINSSETLFNLALVGGDFNGEYKPAYLKDFAFELAQRRFKLFKNEGYKHAKNELKTAYNKEIEASNPSTRGLCTLDHLLIKNADMANIQIQQRLDNEFKFPLEDVTKNASDHRPLLFTVKA